MKLKATANQTEYEIDVEVEKETPSLPSVVIDDSGGVPAAAPALSVIGAAGVNVVVAPLAELMARVLIVEDNEVEAGQVLLVLEAMKMETEITAPATDTVSATLVKPGEPVQNGQGFIEL